MIYLRELHSPQLISLNHHAYITFHALYFSLATWRKHGYVGIVSPPVRPVAAVTVSRRRYVGIASPPVRPAAAVAVSRRRRQRGHVQETRPVRTDTATVTTNTRV